MQKEYSAHEYLELFRAGRISFFHINFLHPANGIPISMKVILHQLTIGLECEVIVYREGLLTEIRAQTRRVLSVLFELKDVIEGSSLFIGPDTLDYPESDNNWPEHWLKLKF